MNILFLSPAWKVSLIKAFQEANKSNNFKIITADSDPQSPSIYFADRFHIVPLFDSPEFKPHFLDLCREEKIKTIIPLSNKAVAALGNLIPDLKELDIFPVLSPGETIQTCLDKWETYLFCEKNSIPTPQSVLYDASNCDVPLEFPLFLKKRRGEGSKDTHVIKTKEHLSALKLTDEYVVQEYVEGREFTLDILSDFNGKPLSVVPRERLAVRGGEVLKGKTVSNDTLIKWGVEIAGKLNIRGPANIQCIQDQQGKYFFTDFNLRFGSGIPLTIAAGANHPEMLLKLLKGEKVDAAIGEYEENLFMLRYDEAIFKKDM